MSFAIWRSSMVSRLMNDMRGNNDTTGVGLRPTPVVFCSPFRRGRAEAAALRQAGWSADWDGIASCAGSKRQAAIGAGIGFMLGVGRCGLTAWPRGTRVSAFPTQGCGPAALPLGYLGIH